MLKILNISTLLLFVCFLFAPTLSYAFDKDTQNIVVMAEEEENSQSKSKGNNNINEEEEKEVHYYTFENFRGITLKNKGVIKSPSTNNFTLKDELVFKIPSPPPEQKL